ncbi:glutathione S-transferase [Pigmentiphaga soli]|uniref:Glutathione S-transferase n=1 Tax=Pigmentiphaga soli TaxID=1007095 RepID=A0ABP8GGT6_9BURK
MLKVWGRITSINVLKVVWTIRELGLPFERVDVGGAFGGLDTPGYGALNPNRRIPTLDDDGFILWESNAIVRYLAARYGAGSLWPEDPRERGLSDRWMEWQNVEFSPAMVPAFMQLIRTPPEKRNQAAIEQSVARAAQVAMVLEQSLAGQDHVGGSRFTMGDVVAGCAVDRWLGLPIEHPHVPNIRAWHERISARPSAQGLLKQPLQ